MDLSELALTGLATYGEWALGAASLISALGFPLPASMLLLAAGAFMRQGSLDALMAMGLAALGAVLGDSVSYLLGRHGGALTLRRAQASHTWRQADGVFRRWGALTVFLSRFLFTPLALPINLMAGSTGYAPWRFLGSVILGELVWVLAFSGLGYAFADQWTVVSTLAGQLSLALIAGAMLLGGGYGLVRVWRSAWLAQGRRA